MERTKGQTEKQPTNQKGQSKPDPKAKSLSEADLDKVAGGGGYTPPKAGQIDKGGKSW